MKFSHSLLATYLDIPVTPRQLSELIDQRVFEVESFTTQAANFSGVITGKVVKVEPHPNADRLRVVSVQIGTKLVSPIVCGAPNVLVGAIVLVALPGAKLPNEQGELTPLSKATIRGIESQGMLCAAEELGIIGVSEPGIWILPKGTPSGQKFQALWSTEYIYDLSLPANRPDVHSHIGLARELARIFGWKFRDPYAKPPQLPRNSGGLTVKIQNRSGCLGVLAGQLTAKPGAVTPLAIQHQLLMLGQRVIHPVVDVTNFVMAVHGQPLHGFDGKVAGTNITVRSAKSGESLVALNHKTYELNPDILVIANKSQVLDIAGVIGGATSEMTASSDTCLLTASTFSQTQIRLTTKTLQLRSEASRLYEKSLSPLLAAYAFHDAVNLLGKCGYALTGFVAEPKPVKPKTKAIKITEQQVTGLLGVTLEPKTLRAAMKYCGGVMMASRGANGSVWSVNVPWWRIDLEDAPDVTEDILKVIGFNAVTPQPLPRLNPDKLQHHPLWQLERDLKQRSARLGYTEIQSHSLVDHAQVQSVLPHILKRVEVQNPLSRELSHLRSSLLESALRVISHNQKYRQDFAVFEYGAVQFGYGREQTHILLAKAFLSTQSEAAALRLKGDCEILLAQLGFNPQLSFHNLSRYSGEVQATTGKKSVTIGHFGLLRPSDLKSFNLDMSVVWIELNVGSLTQLPVATSVYHSAPFPAITRDLAITVPVDTSWSNLSQDVYAINPLIVELDLFDAAHLADSPAARTFHADMHLAGQKAWGLRLKFQSTERTLTETEITGIYEEIMLKLQQSYHAKIR